MSDSFTLDLPWPDNRLHAHAKGHWRPKADATKAARRAAWALANEAGVTSMPDAVLAFYFYPPDRRKRDLHNMPHAMKATIDGIADAMGCDDNGFKVIWPTKFEAVNKGGLVKVIIRPPVVSIPVVGVVLGDGTVLK